MELHTNIAREIIGDWKKMIEIEKNLGRFPSSQNRKFTDTDKFDKNLGGETKRVEKAISILSYNGVLNRNSTILDLGCGTGTFSIAIAPHVKQVDALDISEDMLSAVHRKAKSHGITNIRTICDDCYHFSEKQPYGKYDLVIASLNPAFYLPGGIEAMIALSKGSCLYCGPYQHSRDKYTLDKYIWGDKVIIDDFDYRNIILPFSVLFFEGFRPQIEYMEATWTSTESIDEAMERLVNKYNERGKLTDTEREKILTFVMERSEHDIYRENVLWYLGFIFWLV